MIYQLGQIIEFDTGNDTALIGEIITRMDGIKPHYVVRTAVGLAYVSDAKILQVFPKTEIGSTVTFWRNGKPEEYAVLSVTVRTHTAIIMGACRLTGNIVPLPIQEIASNE